MFQISDERSYRIVGFSSEPVCSDSSGGWWIQPYSARLSFTNTPYAAWYSSADTNVSFEVEAELTIRTRGLSVPPVEAGLTFDMEVSIQSGKFLLVASYSGVPTVSELRRGAELNSSGYVVATGPLTWMSICFSGVESSECSVWSAECGEGMRMRSAEYSYWGILENGFYRER